MPIIYTYPRLSGELQGNDLILITDVSDGNKTKNTTIQSINDLGPQGTVTDVTLNMPDGFQVQKVPNPFSEGEITFNVTGFATKLPADDPANSIQYNENGDQKGSIQFTANPIFPGTTLEEGVSMSVGYITRTTTGVQPKRGVIRIGSGPTNQSDQNAFGGTVLLEYVYPANGPSTPSNAAAYSFVGLRAPKYDINTDITQQDYDLVFPQLNPEYSTNNQPYEDASGNNISQLLVVNPVDASNNSQRFYETKFVSVDNLGIGAAGENGNIQFNSGGNLAGNSAFVVMPDNGTAGVPDEAPNAHELLLGAASGGLPGMLTLFGDSTPIAGGGVAGILRFMAPTGQDFATITGPDNQTEISLTDGGSGYTATVNPVETSGGTGSGLLVFITVDQGAVTNVSLAAQGSGYANNQVLTILEGDENATITITNARVGADEKQMYDIKLPKYAPGDDKIWFGKGTGKNTELTTNDYFKIKLVDFDPGEGHYPGGRLQLEIGSPNQTVQEPWGSILLNAGDNTNESGVLRLASVYNNTVGVMGPKAVNPLSIPVGETYDYDFMLPAKPPRVAQRAFINGVDTANLTSAGSELDYGNGVTLPRVSTTVIDPTTGTKIEGAGEGCIVSVTIQNPNPGAEPPEGTVASFSIVDAGDGYAEGDVLKLNTSGTDELKKARITVTAVEGNKGKVLVVNESASTTTAFPYETRWIDFPLPRLNHGFSPYHILLHKQMLCYHHLQLLYHILLHKQDLIMDFLHILYTKEMMLLQLKMVIAKHLLVQQYVI